jgi:hypothetical protein
MSYYIPLPCCECTASTNPCDLPCFVSGVATISGTINVVASGNGNRVAVGSEGTLSPAPYIYSLDFSLDDEINLNSSGTGQTSSVVALFNQEFQYAAGVNCPTTSEDCTASIVVDGIPTFDLSCPANVCLNGQQYQIGTSLSLAENDFQETNCAYSIPPDGDFDDHITRYYCDETQPLGSDAGVGLSYVACSPNGFSISFQIESSLNISTTQEAGYVLVGQIFIDNLAPRPLYAGYAGFAGDTSKTVTGSLNVVLERVIGYINENSECVAP